MERHLHLRLKPSTIFRVYLLTLLLLCWSAIALAALHDVARFAIACAVTIVIWRNDRACRSPAVVAITLEGGLWQLETASGLQEARLCADSVVTYSITVLHFQGLSGSSHYVVLLPDSGDAESLRQLRVLLLNGTVINNKVVSRHFLD